MHFSFASYEFRSPVSDDMLIHILRVKDRRGPNLAFNAKAWAIRKEATRIVVRIGFCLCSVSDARYLLE